MSCYIVPNTAPYMKVAYVPRLMYNYGYPSYGPLAQNPATPSIGATPTLAQQQVMQVQTAAFQAKTMVLASHQANVGTKSAVHSPSTSIDATLTNSTAPRIGDKRSYDEACIGGSLSGSLAGATPSLSDLTRTSLSNIPGLAGIPHPGLLTIPGLLPSPQTKFLRPLYCKVCRVTLNAPAQAKQHYEGKSHARRMKMSSTDDSEDTTGRNSVVSNTSSTDGASSTVSSDESTPGSKSPQAAGEDKGMATDTEDGADKSNKESTDKDNNNDTKKSVSPAPKPPTPEIQPEVYCKVCGVSFNSDKQATQHYKGKTHAKRIRATNLVKTSAQAEKNAFKQGMKFSCLMCNIHVTSQEQLECHMKGSRHYATLQSHDQTTRAIRGHWIQQQHHQHQQQQQQQQQQHQQQQQNSMGVMSPLLSLAMSPSSLAFQQAAAAAASPLNPASMTAPLTGSASLATPMPGATLPHTGATCIPAHAPSTSHMTPAALTSGGYDHLRTPSGQFYCSSCNLTVSSEPEMHHHVATKRHRVAAYGSGPKTVPCGTPKVPNVLSGIVSADVGK